MMIYIHIPYCHNKCIYCGFVSKRNLDVPSEYIDALCKEIAMRGDGSAVETLYIGGGTPSLLSKEQLQKILQALRQHFDLSSLQEATIECNPESASRQWLSDIHELGIFNRISIGIQSFNNDELKFLSRLHDKQTAIDAVTKAHNIGFDNISIDLIYGMPKQTLESWQQSLDEVSHLPVSHLSCYSLTLAPNTELDRFYNGGLIRMPSDDEQRAYYDYLVGEWLKPNGFEQYEISNFCKNNRRSLHNSGYWSGKHYMGFGCAAHSYDGKRRYWNDSEMLTYYQYVETGINIHQSEEILSEQHKMNEIIMLSLRTVEGLDKSRIYPQFKEQLLKSITVFIKEGLIEETPTHFKPTTEGIVRADGIACELFFDD